MKNWDFFLPGLNISYLDLKKQDFELYAVFALFIYLLFKNPILENKGFFVIFLLFLSIDKFKLSFLLKDRAIRFNLPKIFFILSYF